MVNDITPLMQSSRLMSTDTTFTIPDLLLGHCANWAQGAKFEIPEGPVADYFKRVTDRPAYQRAKEKTGY